MAIRSNLCSRTMTGFVLAFLVFHGVSFRSDSCTNRAEFLRGRNHKGRKVLGFLPSTSLCQVVLIGGRPGSGACCWAGRSASLRENILRIC